MFPFCAFVFLSFRKVWKDRKSDIGRFLLCWIIPTVFFFSFIRTKLPHYIAPVFPGLVLMIGYWWNEYEKSKIESVKNGKDILGWNKFASIFNIVLGIILLIALPITIYKLKLTQFLFHIIVISTIIFIMIVLSSYYMLKKKFEQSFLSLVFGIIILLFLTMLWVLPSIEYLRPSKVLATWLKENAPKETKLMAVKYQEPSLVFYWGKTIDMLGTSDDEDGLAALLNPHQPAALVIPNKNWNKWVKKNKDKIPPNVNIRFKKDFVLFQRGKWDNIVIVGNW
jgi:4-amino-4-deoxy-L-arabinose transferase-like glycosyltransferase